MKKLWKPKLVYTNAGFLEGYSVLTENGKILSVDRTEHLEQENQDAEVEVWDNMAMVPGTVNVHNHCFQSLLRGLATDRPFLEWRDQAL